MTTHHLGPWGTVETWPHRGGIRWVVDWRPLLGGDADAVRVAGWSPTLEAALEAARAAVARVAA